LLFDPEDLAAKLRNLNQYMNDLVQTVVNALYEGVRPAFGIVGGGASLWIPRAPPEYFRARRLTRLGWTTLFGPPYVETYGRDFLLGAPGFLKRELADGGILYQVTKEFAHETAPAPSVEEVLAYFQGHPKIPRLRFRHIQARDFFEDPSRVREEWRRRLKAVADEAQGVADSVPVSGMDQGRSQSALSRGAKPPDPVEPARLAELFLQTVEHVAALSEEVFPVADFEEALDLSPDSLRDFELLLQEVWISDPVANQETLARAGAYLGEVVVRHLGGRWDLAAEPGTPLVVGVPGVAESLRPLDVIREAMEAETSTPTHLKAWFQALERRARQRS
jgi:hypothetical protein